MTTRKSTEAAAVSLLLRQPVSGEFALHFLDFRHLVTGPGIGIEALSRYETRVGKPLPRPLPDGVTVRRQDTTLIFYNDETTSQTKIAFTVAHELGHVLLGHTGLSSAEERQADRFAASLLMPEAVIRFLDCQFGTPIGPERMAAYFPASLSACRLRRREIVPGEPFRPSPEEAELVRRLFRANG